MQPPKANSNHLPGVARADIPHEIFISTPDVGAQLTIQRPGVPGGGRGRGSVAGLAAPAPRVISQQDAWAPQFQHSAGGRITRGPGGVHALLDYRVLDRMFGRGNGGAY